MRVITFVLYWLWQLLSRTAVMVAIGAALGAVAFPVVGHLARSKYTSAQLALNGIHTLGFYFLMWAPGVAIVLCVMKAHNHYTKRTPPDGDSPGGAGH